MSRHPRRALWRVFVGLAFATAELTAAARYSAVKTTDHAAEVVRLSDDARGVTVFIAPSLGNRAYAFEVHGQNILYFDWASKGLNGIPFLAPWANRMAGGGFWAEGKKYLFNPDLGSVHVDKDNIAIHGMLSASPLWEVAEVKADKRGAEVTSRLPFWKYPELMANWPFAHEYEMTYRLSDGVLEVRTMVTNRSAQSMPVAVGFHPYFVLPGVPRAEASAHIPAHKHVETDAKLVATGEFSSFDAPAEISLRDHTFDDGYTDLERDAQGRATLSVSAAAKKIEVIYGPKYPVAVVYAPPNQPFICFEPMSAITNGVNLSREGKYPALQTLASGQTWQESFWVKPSGF